LTTKNKFLGIDKHGKPWYVTERRSKDTISFFVVSEESQDGGEDQFVVKAVVHRISKNRAVVEDIFHRYHRKTVNRSFELDNAYQDDWYQQYCIGEPELKVAVPDKEYGPSLSEVLSGLEPEEDSSDAFD
jgi:hypothetical protein